MNQLFQTMVIVTVISIMNGKQENICVSDKEPLQCNDLGMCQCCLTNGTAATNEPSDKIKLCQCFVEQFESNALPPLGRFTPKCEDDGSYSPFQSHPSTGLSWCAHPENGNNITEKGRSLKACKCLVENVLAKDKPTMGKFTPKCEDDGTYAKLQTHASIGQSWCVEPTTGQNITEMARAKYQACDCLVEKYLAAAKPRMGRFTPKCEEDGTYSMMQSHGSTGMKWCVEPTTGQNVTEKARGVYKACKCIVESYKANQSDEIGNFVPQCEKDGTYSMMQSHEPTGMSWCVEPTTGENVTEKAVDVYKACKCIVESYKANQSDKIGKFVPKCEDDGRYVKKQLHSSSGKGWCADPYTGDELIKAERGADLFCECIVQKTQAEKNNNLGSFIPSCEKDGSFSKKQIYASTGMSFCVDPKTGANISEPVRGEVTCE